jgi:hypothetical protein
MIRNLPLLLVHGVGHHKPGALEAIVSDALGEAGVEHVVPSEFNWDGLFRRSRRSRRSLDAADMTALGHAFWAASWIGVADAGAAPWKLRAIRAGSSILTAVVALCILAAIWWLAAYGASRFATPVPPIRVGLPWSAYWFPPIPPDLLGRTLPAASIVLGVLSRAILPLAGALAAFTWMATSLPLLSALRMSVFQLLWFPTYVLGTLPAMLIALAATAFGVAFISTGANLKFMMQLPDGTTWVIGPGWREVGSGILVALALAAIAAGASWVVWRALKPIIDVVRYIGDGQLRDDVHAQFLSKVDDLAATSSRIVVAAHSLGTVITADSLASHPGTWTRFESIDLVTAGSPLHRLLARFFPSAYPPVRDLADHIVRAYPSLRWANVYRPTDYVGGYLPSPRIANRCLFRSAWRTHGNYWGDRHAIGWLTGQMRLARTDAPGHGPAFEPPPRLAVEERLRTPHVPRRAVTWLLRPIGLLGCAGIVWSQFYWTPRVEQANLAEWQRRTRTEGRQVVVDAVRALAIDPGTDESGPGEYEVVALYYRANGEIYGAESKVGSLPYATPRFPHVDWARLKADLDASGHERLPVEVVYATSAPRIFIVPKYAVRPSYYGAGRIFFYLLRTAVLLGCWFVWFVGLGALLENLAPGERAIGSFRAAGASP